MSRGMKRSSIRIESLEDRCTPAGTVNVSPGLGGINITGDPEANAIRIGPGAASGSIKVVALDGTTTITGTPELDATNQNINVLLGAGADQVEILGPLNLKQLVVNLGTGDNSLRTIGSLAVTGDMKILQSGLAGTATSANIDIATGLVDSISVDGNFTYQSTGAVNDSILIGSGDVPAEIDGTLTALLGAGSNSLNVQASTLGAVTVTDQSPAQGSVSVSITTPNIIGDVKMTLGRGDGGIWVNSTSQIGGSVSISNTAAKQSFSVAVVGNPTISENFTVNLKGESANVLVRANGVLGNVSLTNRATKSATIDANIVTITGSSVMNVVQPTTSGAGTAIDATLTSSFIQNDLRSTTSGPGTVFTGLNLNTLNGSLQSTSRGTAGDQVIHSARINGNVQITAAGLDSIDGDLGTVKGSALITITGTTFSNIKAQELKNAIITISGARAASVASVGIIEAATVQESMTVTFRHLDSGIVRSNGNIGGDLKVASNNVTTTVQVADVSGDLIVNATNTDDLNVTADDVIQNLSVIANGVDNVLVGITNAVNVDAKVAASNAAGTASSIADLRSGSNAFGFTASPATTITSQIFASATHGPATFTFTNNNANATVTNADQDVTINIRGALERNVTLDNSTIAGNLKINHTGLSANVFVHTGSVAGTATFMGGNIASGKLDVAVDDMTLNHVIYTGGLGTNRFRLDTDNSKALTSAINGNFTVNLGGGSDEIQFGDGNPLPSLFERVDFASTSLISINGGPGDDTLFNFNSNVDQADMTLISINYDDTP